MAFFGGVVGALVGAAKKLKAGSSRPAPKKKSFVGAAASAGAGASGASTHGKMNPLLTGGSGASTRPRRRRYASGRTGMKKGVTSNRRSRAATRLLSRGRYKRMQSSGRMGQLRGSRYGGPST